ncbi:MAG: OmpA family protein, partial [Solirubrobacteraceae bacterium]
ILCKQRALDTSKTREKLLLEKQSLDQERLQLIGEIENERAGNASMRDELTAERAARASKEAEIQQLSGTYQSLVEQLESEVRSGDIEIEELRGRLQVRALDQILFDSGSVEIKPRGREVLVKIAQQLAKVTDRQVRVEGHTDDVPIATPRFPSNWELSVGRAAAVARLLAEQGVSQQHLEVAGFGEFHPIAANDAPEGRARNRRIEIVLAPLAAPVAE